VTTPTTELRSSEGGVVLWLGKDGLLLDLDLSESSDTPRHSLGAVVINFDVDRIQPCFVSAHWEADILRVYVCRVNDSMDALSERLVSFFFFARRSAKCHILIYRYVVVQHIILDYTPHLSQTISSRTKEKIGHRIRAVTYNCSSIRPP